MSSRRLARQESGMGSESGFSRYDFGGADEGQEYSQLYRYLARDRGMDGEASDFESESGDSQDLSIASFEAAEITEQEELESQAAAAVIAQSNADASNQISSGLMHRIASTLSLSTPNILKAEGAIETPVKIVAAAQDMEMSEEVTSAAADLERCIQVPNSVCCQLNEYSFC